MTSWFVCGLVNVMHGRWNARRQVGACHDDDDDAAAFNSVICPTLALVPPAAAYAWQFNNATERPSNRCSGTGTTRWQKGGVKTKEFGETRASLKETCAPPTAAFVHAFALLSYSCLCVVCAVHVWVREEREQNANTHTDIGIIITQPADRRTGGRLARAKMKPKSKSAVSSATCRLSLGGPVCAAVQCPEGQDQP